MSTTASPLDTLLQAAVLAPSGDNTQPWRFTVDRERWTIAIDIDPSRDPSPMNAGQRMAWIAVGAAFENMIRTAECNGWQYQLHQSTAGEAPQITIEPTLDVGTIDPVLAARGTNRRVYEGGEISPACLARLEAASGEIDGVRAHWITDLRTLDQLGRLVSRADALILGTKPIRDAFLSKVRFDRPANAVVDEGLSVGSLELPAFEQRFLKAMRHMPDGILRPLGVRKIFAGAAKKLIRSSSGICLISSPDNSFATRIPVGRVWERAWLALTAEKLAAQPMMSICVLKNIHDHGEAKLVGMIGRSAVTTLLKDFSESCNRMGIPEFSVLMRFGFSPMATARTGRLPPQRSESPFPAR